MKRFLIHITFFAIPLILGGIALECIAERIPNSYTYKHQYMEQHAAHIRTIILGSSYAYDGLAPSEMPAAFNLSNSSQTLEDDYRLLARYIPQMDSLQTAVLGVGYGTLAMRTQDNRRLYYTLYMDLYPRWPISKYSMEVFDMPLLTKKIIKYIISRDVTRCDSLGQRLGHDSIAVAQQTEFWNKDIAAMVENDKVDVDAIRDVIAQNSAYLDSIASLCAARDVQLLVVSMPAMDAYVSALPPKQVALHDSIFSALTAPAVYIDATDWEVPEGGWYNPTHLTREASIPFTHWLLP